MFMTMTAGMYKNRAYLRMLTLTRPKTEILNSTTAKLSSWPECRNCLHFPGRSECVGKSNEKYTWVLKCVEDAGLTSSAALHTALLEWKKKSCRMSKMDVSDKMSFCRFSGWKSRPYMSTAERKMDSIWLWRSSYAGWWAAIRTW